MQDDLGLKAIARMIDHSLLHPALTDAAIASGCQMARQYGLASACVKPYSVPQATRILAGSSVAVCAVIAFPHGNSTTAIKVKEAEEAVKSGAREIDMVVNIGKVLGNDWNYVSREISAINELVVGHGGILKVIFENDYLDDAHIVKLCEICAERAVAFVKTSTGYGFVKQANGMYAYAGATDHHLQLMRAHCPTTIGLKAAGGVRTLDHLLRVRQLGASRVGASATAEIMEEARRRGYR